MKALLNGESRIILLVITALSSLAVLSLVYWNAEASIAILTCFTSVATMCVREHYALKRYEIERDGKPIAAATEATR